MSGLPKSTITEATNIELNSLEEEQSTDMNSNKKVIFIVIAITLVILYYNSSNIMNYINTISEFKYENLDKDLPENLVEFKDVSDEDYFPIVNFI